MIFPASFRFYHFSWCKLWLILYNICRKVKCITVFVNGEWKWSQQFWWQHHLHNDYQSIKKINFSMSHNHCAFTASQLEYVILFSFIFKEFNYGNDLKSNYSSIQTKLYLMSQSCNTEPDALHKISLKYDLHH